MTGRLRLLAAVVAAAIAFSGCGISFQTLPQLGSSGSFPGYPLKAVFSNVENLAQNAKVRYGDAVVGAVTSIRARDFRAELTMKVKRSVRLPEGTTAQVMFQTPLGGEYVQLIPPAGTASSMLRPGATIGLQHTSAAPTVADTLAALGAVLYGSGLGQARTVITSVNQILSGNHQPVRQLLGNLDTALGSLSTNDVHIDRALAAAANILSEINRNQGSVTMALDTLPPAAAAVSADNHQLQELLHGINQLSPIVTDVLARSGQNLVADVSQAVPVLQSLESVDASFGTDSSNFTRLATAMDRATPNDYVHLSVNFTGEFPPAEPIPGLAPIVGCTTPTPPAHCPPGSSLVSLLTAGLP